MLRVARNAIPPWQDPWCAIYRHPLALIGAPAPASLHTVELVQTAEYLLDLTTAGCIQLFASQAEAQSYADRMSADHVKYKRGCAICYPLSRSPWWWRP